MPLGVGDAAPDFTLPGTGEVAGEARTYTLSSFRGQPVVLVFYPGDNSAVCTLQLKSYTADFDEFEGVNAQVLAISPQSLDSHCEFSRKHGFKFPLLADVDKQVGEAYGVLGPVGFYRRSTFVVDAEGTIRYAHRSLAGLTYRKTDELIAAVRSAT